MNRTQPGPGFTIRFIILMIALLAIGCMQPGGEEQDRTPVTLLTYQEQEAGVEPYPLRILANEHFLRFDDGYDASDFMLMDRDTRTIYSISHEDQSILMINAHPEPGTMPAGLVLTEERDVDAGAPDIAGKHPLFIRFLASGTVCYQAVVVPGLLQEVSAALAEYATALGNRQFSDMASVPGEMLTPCFLSRYVYAPARHLHDGLPVSEWDDAGYRRTLIDYREDEMVEAELFTLPEAYEKFTPGD
jgi:hypothetical protein